jgi:hypothetical protein
MIQSPGAAPTALIPNEEGDKVTAFAMLIPSLDWETMRKGVEKASPPDPASPVWAQKLQVEMVKYLASQCAAATGLHVYFVFDSALILRTAFEVMNWILSGAQSGIEDREIRAYFARLQSAADRAARGEDVNWSEVLGIDLSIFKWDPQSPSAGSPGQ